MQEDESLKQLQFFSVASDGRVTLWTLAKSELLHQVRLQRSSRLFTDVYHLAVTSG